MLPIGRARWTAGSSQTKSLKKWKGEGGEGRAVRLKKHRRTSPAQHQIAIHAKRPLRSDGRSNTPSGLSALWLRCQHHFPSPAEGRRLDKMRGASSVSSTSDGCWLDLTITSLYFFESDIELLFFWRLGRGGFAGLDVPTVIWVVHPPPPFPLSFFS